MFHLQHRGVGDGDAGGDVHQEAAGFLGVPHGCWSPRCCACRSTWPRRGSCCSKATPAPDAAGRVIEAFGHFPGRRQHRGGPGGVHHPHGHQLRGDHQGRRADCRSGRALHLDAMPGKQMAIDADLNAGLIDEKEAEAPGRASQEADFTRRDGRCLQVRPAATRWRAS